MTRKKLGLYILIGLLYFILALPVAGLNFADGYSEIRFTGLLPMAAGMLCGFPGALACALGNFAGDLASGLDIYCVFGFAGNFLMAWLPYKLWHTLFFSKNHLPQYLGSPGSIFKFVLISIVSCCGSVGVIAAGGQLLRGFSFGGFFLPVSLQYYDFSLLGGMLIFQICLTVFHLTPHIPKKAYSRIYHPKRYIIDYLLAGILVAASCALAVITAGAEIKSSPAITALCLLIMASSAALACLPMARDKECAENKNAHLFSTGLQAQFVTIFLLILCLILVIVTTASFRLLYMDFKTLTGGEGNILLLPLRVMGTVAIVGTFFIIVLPMLLRAIQRKVVDPIGAAAAYTGRFVEGGELEDEPLVFEKAGNEIDDLGGSINVMADNIRSFIEDIRLRTVKEEKLAAELNVARNIQQGLLPDTWTGTGFDLAPYIKPAKEVGGDFYHFSQLDEDRVFVCIADVSGKDISAAMFMVQAKTLMEASCQLPPDQMLTKVNDTLSASNQAMMFVTVFAAVLDKKTRRMTYANAGHNPPVCFNDGQVLWLDQETDFVLGPMEGTNYQQHTLDMAEDFKLFIYTDGVNEAENAKHEFFGNDRLFARVGHFMKEGYSCEQLVNELSQELETFAKGAQQSDDITMLAVSGTGGNFV